MDDKLQSYDNASLELSQSLMLAQHTVYKQYLTQLTHYPILKPSQVLLDETPDACVRMLQLQEFSCKKGEDIFQKLSTVYHASMAMGATLFVMIDVPSNRAPANFYIGVRYPAWNEQDKSILNDSYRTLNNGIESNFLGTKASSALGKQEMTTLLDGIFKQQNANISAVSCIASIRDKSKTENKHFIQGIERLVDTVQGETYTALFISEPVSPTEQAQLRMGYENLYSSLSAFQKSVWSYNESNSHAVAQNLTTGISDSITEGTALTQSHTKNVGFNVGINGGKSSQTSTAHGTSTHNAVYKIASAANVALKVAAVVVPPATPILSVVNTAANFVDKNFDGIGTIVGGSITDTLTNAVGKSLGLNGGASMGRGSTQGDTQSKSTTHTTTENRTSGTTTTDSQGRTLQIEMVNKSVSEMLKRLDEQLKRVREGEDYGSYNCGAYFISGKTSTCLLAANTYRALMMGEGSSIENGAINYWDGRRDKEVTREIKKYLQRFTHPVFAVSMTGSSLEENPVVYTPAAIVSGLELPLHLGLPTRSVYGLPVIDHAEFGRSVHSQRELQGQTLHLGNIYHMGKVEKTSVDLNIQNLTAHTFITGSTGSGKSNTVYQLLTRLNKQNVHFMVIEPAKGEYQAVLGNHHDVTVYSTNPRMRGCQMLRLNPFRFPKNVHILEHLDRLVEIFNVCWAMYAAMPAILKDAIERAYVSAGWDLVTSENRYDNELFPTFADVAEQIQLILNDSAYSSDNKGDYTGALVTRLTSLTNGINGLVFTSNDIPDATLFDENTIVDLSRVGSSETKALMMGILVLKLHEYRSNQSTANAKLHHVTVLEEAHHLLRRTSTEQVNESANLMGKSVELLANSIAEMRTYGEGFVIADQSPCLLDMSVIRNTNTKIILRLPDYSDRLLVGKAAGLNDDQIIELGKLEQGVAVINQSEWLEPVLCKVDKFSEVSQHQKKIVDSQSSISTASVEKMLVDCVIKRELVRRSRCDELRNLRDDVMRSNLSASVKYTFLEYLNAKPENSLVTLRRLIYQLLHAEKALKTAESVTELIRWADTVVRNLTPSIAQYNDEQKDKLLALILQEKALNDCSYEKLYCCFTEQCRNNKGVLYNGK